MAADTSVAERQGSIRWIHRTNRGTQQMASNTIPFPQQSKSVRLNEHLSDGEIAEMIGRTVGAVQEVMDEAMIAGLVVEPSFSLIERRDTPRGVMRESFVCEVRCFRRLT
jgi:hypothetical protein